jgi:hypothetical protein
MVTQQIVDGNYGSYAVTYHPALTFRAPPKVQIKLPGTEYTVIITPGQAGDDGQIVVVNPSGLVTNIPVYKDERELLRQVGQSREGLVLATVFLPIVVDDDLAVLARRRNPKAGDAENG